MKNNILMIAYTNYATDARVIKEAEAAVDAGFNVDFISLRRLSDKKKEIINNVNVIRVRQTRYRGGNNFLYIMSYIRFMIYAFFKTTLLYTIKKYKIIHVNNIPDFFVFSAVIPKLFGSKIILDIHDPMPNTFLTKFHKNRKGLFYKILLLQERWSARFANSVITVHNPVKNDILVRDGIPKDKIEIIHNFADDSIFTLNQDYRLNNKIKLLFHGTIAERFGFGSILNVLRDFKDINKIHFKIIGEGDFSDNLKDIIKKLELQKIVDFTSKFYPFHKLPNLIKDYHLGLVCYNLSPATEYMLPVKMFELLALGIPVITIPNTAIKYYLTDDMYFSYDPNNLSSFKKLLNQIITNPELILEKRKILLSKRNDFLWSSERKKYISLLKKLYEVKNGYN